MGPAGAIDWRDTPPFHADEGGMTVMGLFTLGRKEDVPRNPAVLPAGQRVYAIGDVHGRLDLLMELLRRIESDNGARGAAQTHVVMLGDLIDRGPESAGVIDLLLRHRPQFARFHFLMGNHEEMLLRQIDAPTEAGMAHFLRYGGRETFESYGTPQMMLDLPMRYPLEVFGSYVVKEHQDFLRAMVDAIRVGDYLFVHAGIRPDVPIEEQVPSDLRWIRNDFLDSEADHGVTVVHGHTIRPEAEMRANRIGIDTGAFASGVLTTLGLEGSERWLMATGA